METPEINDKQRTFISLASKVLKGEDLKRIQPYLKRLKTAVDTKGITNIALAGAYGSGKSTILDTFLDQNKNYKNINISLASFKDNDVSDDKLERALEISILQQLFYHVKPSTIPDSRFKRIIHIPDKKLLWFSLGLIIWILCALLLFKFNYVENINPASWDTAKEFLCGTFITTTIATIGFFLGVACFSKLIIRLFTSSRISKLTIKGEIELGETINKSVFNEHLEEILYFFQQTKYNIVIIEDLDRFESTDIFTKLREINILLNKSELMDGHETVFIYAVRDEMFTDKMERVKFFEYIIPVIPFINSSNAVDQLSLLVENIGLKDEFSENFISDIGTFIFDIDMRLLINIVHEFSLYKESLSPSLNLLDLFAFITYKNLFPEDFSRLHKQEGYLYSCFANKKKYLDSLTISLKEKIEEIDTDITQIEIEKVHSVEELRKIYLYQIISNVPNGDRVCSLHVDNDYITLNDLIQTSEKFHALIKEKSIIYAYDINYPNSRNSSLKYTFEEVEKQVNQNLSYLTRESNILKNQSSQITKLKHSKAIIEKEISSMGSWNLKKIIRKIGIEPILEYNRKNLKAPLHKEEVVTMFEEKGTVKANQSDNNAISDSTPLDHLLVRNFLLNGYLNENYHDYISVFHGVNMSQLDYNFILNVKSGEIQAFEYKLSNIDQVVKKLPIWYFEQDYILNFDLLDFLSREYNKYFKEYDSIIELIKNSSDKSLQFMDAYVVSDRKYIPFFIKQLVSQWDTFWSSCINKHPFFIQDKQDKYLSLILKHAEIDSICELDNNKELTDYIESHESFISTFDTIPSLKFISILDKLNIHFDTLELPTSENYSVFQHIYNNNLYKINSHNIVLLFRELSKDNSDDIITANYTTIMSSTFELLKEYISNNLLLYIENVLLKLSDNTNESEETVLYFLNNEALENDLKMSILLKQIVRISNIQSIENTSFIDYIFANNKIMPIWGNITQHRIEEAALTTFLNIEENYKDLKRQEYNFKDENSPLMKQLFLMDSLSVSAYKHLISKLPHIDEIDFSELAGDKVEWLIENKLKLNSYNYDLLKSTFPNLAIKLIVKHQDDLLSIRNSLDLNDSDYIKILVSTLNLSIKEEIIEQLSFDLIQNSDELKSIVGQVMFKSNKALLEYNVLEVIIEHEENIDFRLKLIERHLKILNTDQMRVLFSYMGEPYDVLFDLNQELEFENKPVIASIMTFLENQQMIQSYKLYGKKRLLKVTTRIN